MPSESRTDDLYHMIGNRMNRRTSALLEKNAGGEIYVSFRALEQIARDVVNRHCEVRNCKTKVRAIGSKITIGVRAVTPPTVSLTEITHLLEREIEAAVFAVCQTAVGKADVLIDQAELPPRKSK